MLIALGVRFSDRVLSNHKHFAENAKIIHVDIDLAEINKNIKADYSLVMHLKEFFTRIKKYLKEKKNPEWVKTVQSWKKEFSNNQVSDSLKPRYFMEAIYEATNGENCFITTEVGQHQLWAAQYFTYRKPKQLITSGGLGTMGYGLGASIGTQVANPDSYVFNIAGDGSFRMNFNELLTMSKYNIPVCVVIANNGVLGMVRQWQNLFFQKHYSETTLDTPLDWVMLANAYGVKGMRLKADDDAEAILKSAFALNEGVVVDCEIPIDDKVLPMVVPGASINDMMGFIDNEGN